MLESIDVVVTRIKLVIGDQLKSEGKLIGLMTCQLMPKDLKIGKHI